MEQLEAGKPRLAIPAYDHAMYAFMSSVMDGMVAAAPLLGEIGVRVTGHAGPTRNVPGAQPVDHPLSKFEETFQVHADVIRSTNADEFTSTLAELASKYEVAMGTTLIHTLTDVTEAVGNVVEADGRPLTWDLLLDSIEKVEVSFDEDGRHHLGIAINSDTYKLLQRIPVSPEQQQRLNAIIRRKKEQWDAQKRARRLPRSDH